MNNIALYGAITAAVLIVVVILFVSFITRRRPVKLNTAYFLERWNDLQKKCADKNLWPLAVIDADKLLDEALKKRRYKGKTMGERLVSAQRDLSSNDTVWFAHKLRNRLVHENVTNLKENEVKQALTGFRQALRDLGALNK